MKRKIDSIKRVGVFLLSILIPFFILIVLIKNLKWYMETIYPILFTFSEVLFLFSIFVLIPLSLIKITRNISATLLFISTYFWGFMLWTSSFAYTLIFGSVVVLIVGLLFVGIGVVPVGYFYVIINAEWNLLVNLIMMTVMTFGFRYYSIYILNNIEEANY